MRKDTIEIISVYDCLRKNLGVPKYQRPYKWDVKNVTDLLLDIEHAIDERKLYADFKYRVGTIILHRDDDSFQIVDGQQRIISLTLLNCYLDADFNNSILQNLFYDNITFNHIHNNFQCIKEWFSLRNEEDKSSFIDALKNILEVVVIYVEKESEAFQLFDSQNTRGRALDPHDLLKAYHLREMHNDSSDMENAVNNWETKEVTKIRELFSDYLFPIWNWSRGFKTWNFTDKDIDTYKGVSIDCPYTFARRTYKAMPCFQITEPFISGNDFFEMVNHYLQMLQHIEVVWMNSQSWKALCNCFENGRSSIGIKHVIKLYKAAVLLYYDRFHNLDKLSLKKLFLWAFMLRIELDNLSFDSINKYAIGNGMSNSISIFSVISQARKHTDISNLIIEFPTEPNFRNCKYERTKLLELLKNMK